MSPFDEALARLVASPCCAYQVDALPAVEPTALAAMALWVTGKTDAARLALQWLVEGQSPDGSLRIDRLEEHPAWPTGWAILAWRTALAKGPALGAMPTRSAGTEPSRGPWSAAAERAVAWTLAVQGESNPRSPVYGHDTTLRGWPWVGSTHSWLEPTAISVMALKQSGLKEHPRCREAVRLILDRMLPEGGWNYGNTVVLGNTLRPHVQPTGLAMAALAGEPSAARAVQQSIDYLDRTLSPQTTTASLCYALIGAAAHGYQPQQAPQWLEAACQRTLGRDGSPHKLALVTLARVGRECPWYASSETAV